MNARNIVFISLIALFFPDTVFSYNESGDLYRNGAARDQGCDNRSVKWYRSTAASPFERLRGSAAVESAVEMDDSWDVIERRLKPLFGYVVDSIEVTGNRRTRRITIVRELATKVGEPLDSDLIRRDSSYLRGLGFFSEVDVSAKETGPGRCVVIVRVEERPGLFMKFPYPIVNYDFEEGVSYGLRWRVKNFRGVGEELYLYAIKLRDKEHRGDVSWMIPWAFGQRLRMRLRLFTYRRLEEPEKDDFIKEQLGGRVSVGLPLTRSLVNQVWLIPSVSFEGRYSRFTPTGGACSDCQDYFRQNFLSAGFELDYDSRDNYLTPSKGVFTRIAFMKSVAAHGLTQQYSFYDLSNYLFLPVTDAATMILALDGMFRDGDLPAFFEMGLGGSNDLRGFEDNDLRGTAKILGTVQLRWQVFGPRVFDIPHIGKFDLSLNGICFVDSASLMNSITDVRGSRFYTTGGWGVEIISPLRDLIRIEAAAAGQGRLVYYLTAGSRF